MYYGKDKNLRYCNTSVVLVHTCIVIIRPEAANMKHYDT